MTNKEINEKRLKTHIEKLSSESVQNWIVRTNKEHKEGFVMNVNPFICNDIIFEISSYLSFMSIVKSVLPVCKVWNAYGLSSIRKIVLVFVENNKYDSIYYELWRIFFKKEIIKKAKSLEVFEIKTECVFMCYWTNDYLEEMVLKKKKLKRLLMNGTDMITSKKGLLRMINILQNRENPKLKHLHLENLNLIFEDAKVLNCLNFLNLKSLTILKIKVDVLIIPTNVETIKIDQVKWINYKLGKVFHIKNLHIIAYGYDRLYNKMSHVSLVNIELKSEFFPDFQSLVLENSKTMFKELPRFFKRFELKNYGDIAFFNSINPLRDFIKSNKIISIIIPGFMEKAKSNLCDNYNLKDMFMKFFEDDVYLEEIQLWDVPILLNRNFLEWETVRNVLAKKGYILYKKGNLKGRCYFNF